MALGGMIVVLFLWMIWISRGIEVPQDLPFYLKPFYRAGKKAAGKDKRDFYYIKLSLLLLVLFAGGIAALLNGFKESLDSVLVEGQMCIRDRYRSAL